MLEVDVVRRLHAHEWQGNDVRRSPTPPAPVLVLGAIASVQSGAAVATRLFPDVGPGGTVLLRLALSALLLLAFVRPTVRSRARADVGWGVAYGVALAAMNATFYEALSRIPLGVAVTIEFVGPLAVAVLGSRRPLDFLWVVLAGTGVALLTTGSGTEGGGIDGLGVLMALVAGGFWAAYILLAQRVGRVYPGASGLAFALVVATVVVAPFGLVTAGTRLWDGEVIGRGAAVAVLSSAVPYSLELFALRRMRASVFGVLMSLEPAMAAVSGLVFLGQHLRAREWAAIVCVMVASIGATRGARREELPVDPGATPTEVLVP
jgi:inner membrane transporter RhtA